MYGLFLKTTKKEYNKPMKKFLKNIFYIVMFMLLLGTSNQSNADLETCEVTKVTFSVTSETVISNNNTFATIYTENCETGISLKMYGVDEYYKLHGGKIKSIPSVFYPNSNGMVKVKIEVDEGLCDTDNNDNGAAGNYGHECVAFLEVFSGNNIDAGANNKIWTIPQSERTPQVINPQKYNQTSDIEDWRKIQHQKEFAKKGILLWDCGGANCAGDTAWYKETIAGTFPDESKCKLNSGDVYFDQLYNSSTPVAKQIILEKLIRLNIKTKGKCDNVPLNIRLKEVAGTDGTIGYTNLESDYLKIIPRAGEDTWITYKGHEEGCYGADSEWDCQIYAHITNSSGQELFSGYEKLVDIPNDIYMNGVNYKKGVISAECASESDCTNFSNEWSYQGSNASISGQAAYQFIANQVGFDSSSPCYIAEDIESGTPEGYDPKCYEFLAPIPGIEIDAQGEQDQNFDVTVDENTGQKRISIRDITQYQIGSFINKLFQIAVAILAVIAVIMIVIAGVQYMTVESIYGKSNARQRIVGAVGGLILALGIFIILNTINPQLLQINFGENLKEVKIEVLDGLTLSAQEASEFTTAPAAAEGYYTLPSSGPVSSCSGKRVIAGKEQIHGALDIKLVVGTPIFAAASGTVTRIQTGCPERPNGSPDNCGNGFGNKIYISHDNGQESIYAHLSTPLVNKGDKVTKSQKIGLSGNSGHTYGPHLHFQIQDIKTKAKKNLDYLTPACSS